MSSLGFEQLVLAQAGPGGGASSLIPLVLILGVFYFLLVRPQQQQAKKHDEFVKALKRGDEVVTTSGLYGKILEVHDAYVVLEVGSNAKVRYQRDKISAGQGQGKEVKA